MSSGQTFASVSMKLAGQTLFTVGTCVTSTGMLYGIHKATSHGIDFIHSIPNFVSDVQNPNVQNPNPKVTIQSTVIENIFYYLKVTGVVMGGVGIKSLGIVLQSDAAINMMEGLLYGGSKIAML